MESTILHDDVLADIFAAHLAAFPTNFKQENRYFSDPCSRSKDIYTLFQVSQKNKFQRLLGLRLVSKQFKNIFDELGFDGKYNSLIKNKKIFINVKYFGDSGLVILYMTDLGGIISVKKLFENKDNKHMKLKILKPFSFTLYAEANKYAPTEDFCLYVLNLEKKKESCIKITLLEEIHRQYIFKISVDKKTITFIVEKDYIKFNEKGINDIEFIMRPPYSYWKEDRDLIESYPLVKVENRPKINFKFDQKTLDFVIENISPKIHKYKTRHENISFKNFIIYVFKEILTSGGP